MCWAVLDLFLAGARGLGLSDLEYKQVVQLKIERTYPGQTIEKVSTAGATPLLLQQI
jgi:hypothetical protein